MCGAAGSRGCGVPAQAGEGGGGSADAISAAAPQASEGQGAGGAGSKAGEALSMVLSSAGTATFPAGPSDDTHLGAPDASKS